MRWPPARVPLARTFARAIIAGYAEADGLAEDLTAPQKTASECGACDPSGRALNLQIGATRTGTGRLATSTRLSEADIGDFGNRDYSRVCATYDGGGGLPPTSHLLRSDHTSDSLAKRCFWPRVIAEGDYQPFLQIAPRAQTISEWIGGPPSARTSAGIRASGLSGRTTSPNGADCACVPEFLDD
jgi:hypothetical protein